SRLGACGRAVNRPDRRKAPPGQGFPVSSSSRRSRQEAQTTYAWKFCGEPVVLLTAMPQPLKGLPLTAPGVGALVVRKTPPTPSRVRPPPPVASSPWLHQAVLVAVLCAATLSIGA